MLFKLCLAFIWCSHTVISIWFMPQLQSFTTRTSLESFFFFCFFPPLLLTLFIFDRSSGISSVYDKFQLNIDSIIWWTHAFFIVWWKRRGMRFPFTLGKWTRWELMMSFEIPWPQGGNRNSIVGLEVDWIGHGINVILLLHIFINCPLNRKRKHNSDRLHTWRERGKKRVPNNKHLQLTIIYGLLSFI